MSVEDRLRSLQHFFPGATLADLMSLMAPKAMPPSFGPPPNLMHPDQQQLNRWVGSAPELQSVNPRRPVTTGSDFIP